MTPGTRSAFVSIVGRPNVGKSTLLNTLVGEKVAIVSDRPQTTRSVIRGVRTDADRQLVLVDTPGLHKPRTALGERLNALVRTTLGEVDVICHVVDAHAGTGSGDVFVADRLAEVATPALCVVNKVDRATPAQIAAALERMAGAHDYKAFIPVSARTGEGVDTILAELDPLVASGPWFFPEGETIDQPEETLVAELVREKFLRRLREELPHSLAVRVDDMEAEGELLRIGATVFVERESQKGMVIGKGGVLLRDVGTEARREIEALLGTRVHLELRVRVEKDWQRRDASLERLGW